MNRKHAPMMTLLIILICGLFVSLNARRTSAIWTSGTIYIRPDGSIEPVTAPVLADGTRYTLTDDISSSADGIVIELDNITFDGAEHNIQASGTGTGINLTNTNSVTVMNTRISMFYHGILLNSSSGNTIFGNDLANNHYGISLYSSSGNNLSGNSLINNNGGIRLESSSANRFFHNNLINNTRQILTYNLVNEWDDGYPSGGNYWSDYSSRYPNASEIDSSGLFDTPYVIDNNNMDNYPLINQFVVPELQFSTVLPLLMGTTLLTLLVYIRTLRRQRKLTPSGK